MSYSSPEAQNLRLRSLRSAGHGRDPEDRVDRGNRSKAVEARVVPVLHIRFQEGAWEVPAGAQAHSGLFGSAFVPRCASRPYGPLVAARPSFRSSVEHREM